nr:MAG TPA: tail protein [Caudoviricetes sp.]
MIPTLYRSDETEFTSQGLGSLADAISCTVTEERNGLYELEMEYPQTGLRFADIAAGNIVCAIPSPYRAAQPFRIYKVTKPLNGNVMVYANHISYDLNKIPVKPFAAGTAAEAMTKLQENCAIANGFLFLTDKETAAEMKIETPTAVRSCLGGIQGSVLDTYGGEYEWDRFKVYLKNQRGTDSGVVIRYGKNLTGLTQEGDVTNLVTGIYPYWYSDEKLVTCEPPIIYAEETTGQTAIPVDLTEKFENQPTVEQLKSAAESYIRSNAIGVPEVSLTTKFLNLSQMSGYENMQLLEKCDLCDTVTVQYEQAGINAKAKIVSLKTDVLLERYEQIEIGSIRPNIAQTIASQQTQIDQTATPSVLQQYINSATSWLTGGRGGYVIFRKNANGQPDEILIMDTPDIETATRVWRWNQGGLGYSKNGYNGPYATAITQDGKIVADFITVGTMLANIIKGGTLTLGGSGNGNGVCRVLDANGNEATLLNATGIHLKSSAAAYKSLEYIYQEIAQLLISGDAITGYYNGNRRFRIPFGEDGAAVFDGDAQVFGTFSVYGSAYFAEGWSGTVTAGSSRLTVKNGIITGVS